MTDRTFFTTAVTWGRRSIFQTDRMASLLRDTLFAYRDQRRYFLHEFVIMPNHIHLLLTPADDTSIEKCMQLIKGGFSFGARDLSRAEIWQPSFTNHHVRDANDYEMHRKYILNNPVKRGLVVASHEFPWSSAAMGLRLDDCPPGLKPRSSERDVSQG